MALQLSPILQILLNGVTLGLIYALMGASLTLLWSVGGIPDFAQGGIYIIAGYAAWIVITKLGVPYLASIPIAALVGAVLSAGFEILYIYLLRKGGDLPVLLTAIALFFLLENIAIAAWTAKPKMMPSPLTEMTIYVAGIGIAVQRLLIIGISIALFIAIDIFIKKTKTGMAIRASSEDLEIAPIMGINVNKIFLITWALGGAIVGIASTLISPLYSVFPEMGTIPLLKGLVVVILGGLGSFGGALVAGLILGIIEAFGAVYVSVAYQHGFAFIILLLTLSFLPRGLFGKKVG